MHSRPALDLARGASEGLPGVLRWRASRLPRSSVAVFLDRAEAVDQIPSLEALDCDARAVAAKLGSIVQPGDRVLLLHPPGLDFWRAFFGCIYAGVIAVPVNIPRPGGSMARIQGILHNAEPALVLTTADGLVGLDHLREGAPGLNRMPWHATSKADRLADLALPHASVSGDSIAFLQYTSGTTSAPRGVIVTHRNVLAQAEQLIQAWSVRPGETYVSWLPHYHDMGLIGVLAAFYGGARCILTSYYGFYQNPLRWLSAISDYGARIGCAPNSAYDFCVRKASPVPEGLDLSRWELAVNGAEPVRSSTMRRFTEKFSACGFRWEAFSPSYGLAEATLGVSVSRVGVAPEVSRPESEDTAVVCCGTVLPDVEVAIVDPATLERRSEGEVGEIWVAGPNVAQGYWNRPEQSEETFRAQIAGEPGSRYLRTGDLGFVRDGGVYVSGRIKDLIIIGGRNHYPQEIEATVEACDPVLRHDSGAAFTIEINGEDQLVVVQELGHARKPDELRCIIAAIRKAVSAEHDLNIYAVRLLKPGAIPRTSSGKIQRGLCREAFLSGELQAVNEDIG